MSVFVQKHVIVILIAELGYHAGIKNIDWMLTTTAAAEDYLLS